MPRLCAAVLFPSSTARSIEFNSYAFFHAFSVLRVCALEVRSGLKNPARPDPGPRVLKPDPARARPINLICRPEPEANPKFHILFVRTREEEG